jgi:dTDP-4-dehydrorhamnose 3,5-epimerase
MIFKETKLKGAYIIEIEPIEDERGFFARSFCEEEFKKHGLNPHIAQCNISYNKKKGTLRGMHYQVAPYEETKLVRCTMGAIYDVIVDLRPDSSTFKQWMGVELTQENRRLLYVPEGFAHGFQTLTDNAELIYYHSAFYSPEYERGLRFDDPTLAINWPLPAGAISPKDQSYPLIDNNFKGIEI